MVMSSMLVFAFALEHFCHMSVREKYYFIFSIIFVKELIFAELRCSLELLPKLLAFFTVLRKSFWYCS